nr:VWA domain-containing protein [Pseudomonadota bacterium]
MSELNNFEFSDPLLLLFGLFAPLVFVQASRIPAVVRYSSLRLVDSRSHSLRSRLSWLPAALLALAMLTLSIALAGPRTGNAVSEVKREGIAIGMVVDRSGSMQARDFVRGDSSTSRLDVVKKIFQDFVRGSGGFGEGRPDDLIGLVTFARYADGLCPLTLDHGSLLAILEQIETPVDQREDGTAVREGPPPAAERPPPQGAAPKSVLPPPAGGDNAGGSEPAPAAG